MCFCFQVTEIELKNNAADTNSKEANNSQITAVVDGHCESDNPANKHLNNELITASCHDVNSSLVSANPFEVSVLELDAAEKNMSDNHEQRDGAKSKTVDVKSKSVKSSESRLSGSNHNMESCREAGTSLDEVLCRPSSENVNVNESYVAAENRMHTSPHRSEGLCQDPQPVQQASLLGINGSSELQVTDTEPKNNATDTVHLTANNKEANNSEVIAVIGGHSKSDDPANKHLDNRLITASSNDVNSSSISSLGSPSVAKAVIDKNCSAETSVDDNHVVRGSGVIAQAPSNTSLTSKRPVEQDLVTETDGFVLSTTSEKPVVEVPSVETRSAETSVDDNYSVLAARGSAVIAQSPSDTSLMSKKPVQQDSVTETDACVLSTSEKPVVERPSVETQTDECPVDASVLVVDAQDSPIESETTCHISQSLSSAAPAKPETKRIVDKETVENDNHGVQVNRGSRDMAEVTSNTVVMSESHVQQDTVMQTDDCALAATEKATIEIPSVKTECCQTDECPVDVSMIVVDAQNSPIHFGTTSSIGCSPVRLPTMVTDAKLVETVECSVQTSPRVVDSSCSPAHNVVTCSIGCSPVEVKTRSARTSPILFVQTVGCSVQTAPWMTDAQCSPVVVLHCEANDFANAQNSLEQCSVKHGSAFFTDRPQTQTTADSTIPSVHEKNPFPACGEVFRQKESSVAGSESSYATPTVVDCNDEYPRQVAVTDDQESFEDSTQPLSCEELFEDESPLSYRSTSNVVHKPYITSPSQPTHTLKTRNITNDNKRVDSEDNAAKKLLNMDSSYSLESSQVLPKCSDKGSNEDVKSNHASSEDDADIQQQFD